MIYFFAVCTFVLALFCIVLTDSIHDLRVENKSLGWEAMTANKHLRIAESTLRYHEDRYKKDIAYWKAKDKTSRKRAWEAELRNYDSIME